MADAPDQDSKTEQATAKKKQDALDKGQIPFAREAPVFASLLGILVVVALIIPAPTERLAGDLASLLENPTAWRLDTGTDATRLLHAVSLAAARFAAPLVAVLLVASLAASLLQNVPRLVLERIRPKFSKLSLAAGAKRIFGRQGQTEFLKSLFKFAAVGTIAAVLLRSEMPTAMNALFADPRLLPETVRTVALRLLGATVTATVVLVGADLVWSRFHWERDLRMTKQEIKDEHKQAEGDPVLKARRLSLARDRSRRRMIAAVPKATLVIVNPTHYSVALRYLRDDAGAPVVIAKGRDLIALKIRETAAKHGVPVVSDKALARSLHDSVEVDRMIPPEFYQAVAELLCFLSKPRTGGQPGR